MSKKQSFVETVLATANKSDKDVLREKASDFVMDITIAIKSEIAFIETSVIPSLMNRITIADRDIQKSEKLLLNSKYSLHNSVEEYFTKLADLEKTLLECKSVKIDYEESIKVSEAKIEKFNALLTEVFF